MPSSTLTEAIANLHRAGKLRSPWLPGMLVRAGDDEGRIVWCNRQGIHHVVWRTGHRLTWALADTSGWTVVTTDPATVGGLLALLREASNSPDAGTSHHYGGKWVAVCRAAWEAMPGDRVPDGDTEGEAIASALIALAG